MICSKGLAKSCKKARYKNIISDNAFYVMCNQCEENLIIAKEKYNSPEMKERRRQYLKEYKAFKKGEIV